MDFYQQNAAMNATNTGLANTSPPGPRRILIIDDNPDAAEMLASILELHGQRCMTAHGGQDGLAAVAQFKPEIILLDIGMPVINGYQVAASLRANREIEQPFIIAFTAWNDQTTILRARQAGFDLHITKTAPIPCLMGAIASATYPSPTPRDFRHLA